MCAGGLAGVACRAPAPGSEQACPWCCASAWLLLLVCELCEPATSACAHDVLSLTLAQLARLGYFHAALRACSPPAEVLPVYYKMLAGMGAGALGAFIGNPADLSLVRMQADASLPVAERRNYTGVVNAMSRVIKEEGVLALWRGSSPTMIRAMVLNTAMMTTSDQTKEVGR
ncbi:solute carrier family 25 protein, partial [archaeon]